MLRFRFTCCFFLFVTLLVAQDDVYRMPGNKAETEINFLSSYYNQDGDNAAVTGGTGTEELTDFSNVVIVNLPTDSIQSWNLQLGLDYYTSASTDNIDNAVSSASSEDVRGYGTLTYTRLNLEKSTNWSVRGGFSSEYDYLSFSGGIGWGKEWNEGNTSLQLTAQAFFDRWDLIYPIELRFPNPPTVATDRRRSYNGQVFFGQILGPRLQLGISAEIIYMEGLLSTPFHRVFFQNGELDIERLPGNRVKVPVSLRLNWFPADDLVLRSWYRFYYDDFGILAHTAELEIPVKVGPNWVFGPYYRFHTQTASDYFAPFQTHLPTDDFYTSDFDLSELNSHKIGLGIRYAPPFGILRGKFGERTVGMLKFAELRGSYFRRTKAELDAVIVALGVGVTLAKK